MSFNSALEGLFDVIFICQIQKAVHMMPIEKNCRGFLTSIDTDIHVQRLAVPSTAPNYHGPRITTSLPFELLPGNAHWMIK